MSEKARTILDLYNELREVDEEQGRIFRANHAEGLASLEAAEARKVEGAAQMPTVKALVEPYLDQIMAIVTDHPAVLTDPRGGQLDNKGNFKWFDAFTDIAKGSAKKPFAVNGREYVIHANIYRVR